MAYFTLLVIAPLVITEMYGELGSLIYNCTFGFHRYGTLELRLHNNGTHTIDETTCRWIENSEYMK